ncbi:MAG TPA: YicC family protein, partial [Deltaproteobacteria bacterium]|nr:YicC family protein [Deltaproteobacteria bacterium]
IRVKVPKDMGALEAAIREKVQNSVHRGKVEIVVTALQPEPGLAGTLIDWHLANKAHEQLKAMAETFGGEVTFRDVLAVPGVMVEGRPPSQEDVQPVLEALEAALEDFLSSRAREGEHLCVDIRARIAAIRGMTLSMKDLATTMTSVYKERLHANLSALLAERGTVLDATRLEQEVALLAEKSDITEELVRLEGHIRLLEDTVSQSEGPIGRQADFILQEINREVNTIGSKSQLAQLSRVVIDAKTEIEKIREQVQNIE